MSAQIPLYLSIPEVIKTFCPILLEWVKQNDLIKTDGAIDEIPLKSSKKIINVEDLYINTKTQRVESIVLSNIMKRLEEMGGFSHEECTTIDTFISKKYGHSSPDGMHRAIMAYICGVKQIAIVEQNEHAEDASDEEMSAAEGKFFVARNEKNSPVTSQSSLDVKSNAGLLTEKEQSEKNFLAKTGIRISQFGAEKEKAVLVYSDGLKNFRKLIFNTKSPFRIICEDRLTSAIRFLTKYTTQRSQLDVAIATIYDKLDEEGGVLLGKYLKSEQYKLTPKDFWTYKCQSGYGIETAIIRLSLRFNEWYRSKFDEDIVDIEMFDFIKGNLNEESQHFLYSCLIHKNPVDPVLLSFDQTISSEEEEMVS